MILLSWLKAAVFWVNIFHVIHTCNICDRDAHDLLDVMNFQQYVSGQTHHHGHTLDLVISRKNRITGSRCLCVIWILFWLPMNLAIQGFVLMASLLLTLYTS